MKKNKLNILIIGSGGREHAIVWKVSQSPRVEKIFVAPGNAGTSQIATNIDIKATEISRLIEFARNQPIDLTIVGPDDSLALGIVDKFQKAGLKVFGPSRKAARIESSKAFSKKLMVENEIPTARYKAFSDFDKAVEYVKRQKFPIVIKASGLALGKGVSICESFDQAIEALTNMMVNKTFGKSGSKVIIEEFLGTDQEVSIHCITDGKSALIFPTAQDHKPIFDGDKGPNTGGMGTYAPVPWAREEIINWASKKVIRPILKGLDNSGSKFTGCLYPGLKMTKEGLKVLEFNARFGDPETQSYMRLLETDLIDIIEASLEGRLAKIKAEWKNGFAVCVIIASKGYPVSKGEEVPIYGLDKTKGDDNIVIFHSGTKIKNGKVFASGGRVLGVTATDNTLKGALAKAYNAASKIKFEGMQYRTDIGAKAFSNLSLDT